MILIASSLSSANAATVHFPAFSIDIPGGWIHATQESISNNPGFGSSVSVSRPGSSGELKIVSYDSPTRVDEQVLRNFTNVDESVPLELEEWGDFAGYRYDYREDDNYYRQWWLTNGTILLILVYESESEVSAEESALIDAMVDSLLAAPR